jgi:4-alpha-glucanotransferase
MTNHVLQQLVEMRGIETHYTDAWGQPTTITESSKAKLLKALGYSTDDVAAMESQIIDEISEIWATPLNPVQVTRINETVQVPVRLPIELVTDEFTLRLTCEDGKCIEHSFVPVDQELIHVNHFEDSEFHEYIVALPHGIRMGYHELTLLLPSLDGGEDDVLGTMRLIIAPEACFSPPDIKAGKKVWGLSVQLYCVRSQSNWGIGDFSDLTLLVENAANRGADFIGLNPIHALYPANADACSPYGPSSRRWLNYLYIDVNAVDGVQDASVQKIIQSEEFQTKLTQARQGEYVDYKLVTELKLTALSAVYNYYVEKYLSKNTKQNKAFKAFVKAGGESLDMLVTYDAMQEYLQNENQSSWGWPAFPNQWQDYHNADVAKFKKAHAKRIRFFQFLQWQGALQLEIACQKARDCGMTIGLYRDLAVGVSEGSAEVWGNKDLYCTGVSVGAPPDVLGPLGQNWGLPPMDPRKLYAQAYQPIIDLFKANMQSSGALRIDHVMGLLRLWWVPKGDDAKEGGYVYYPVDDLLGILALESHRHESLVIGEDLGTVPDEIRGKLAANGVYSYRVFFFEQAADGGYISPTDYPVQSMSTLTTHDMPTLIGYWHCLDLELGKTLGLYPTDDILASLYDARHQNKQAILDTLHGHHAISQAISPDVSYVGMTPELSAGMQTHMAKGSSALLSLQLEDWLHMDKPVNVPGTFNEYPNWRRKLTRDLEDIFADDAICHLAEKISAGRKSVSH